MDEKKAKTKVLKILSQAAGERAAGNEEAARNMEEQAAALQKQHNLPEANDDAVRRRVEAAWKAIPLSTQVLLRVTEPGMRRFKTLAVTMASALPLLKTGKATYAGLANGEIVRTLRPGEVHTLCHIGRSGVLAAEPDDRRIAEDAAKEPSRKKSKMFWW